MTATQQFIEDAIAGGCDIDTQFLYDNACDNDEGSTHICFFLLDRLAWQAVGKTRGWTKAFENAAHPAWKDYMHLFIDHLADGKSVEEALALL